MSFLPKTCEFLTREVAKRGDLLLQRLGSAHRFTRPCAVINAIAAHAVFAVSVISVSFIRFFTVPDRNPRTE